MIAASRSSTSWRVVAESAMAVDSARILDDRFHFHPAAAVEPLEEAALAPRVAGNAAGLLDDEQQRVVVAIESDLAHLLHVPRLLALAPETPARTRPIVGLAGLDRARERLAVHP